MENKYVLEYSVTQNKWHIQKISNMLKMNMFNYMKDHQSTFLPLAIADTREEIEEIKQQLIEKKSLPTDVLH